VRRHSSTLRRSHSLRSRGDAFGLRSNCTASRELHRALDQIYDQLLEEIRSAVEQDEHSTAPYLSVPEAAEYLRAKPQRVYDLLSSGRLARHKDGSRVLISRAELASYLARGNK